MANFDTIKTAIDANIKTNGTQDITGGKMNSILHQMVDATDEQLTELESDIISYKEVVNNEIEDFKENITDQVNNYAPIVINGDVTNAPDEEDLTSLNGLLKFKNRSALNGMGYVIVRKDKTFAEQVSVSNTIYEICYDFDLNGEDITIPEGCVLHFNGGKIVNGSINLNMGVIDSNLIPCFEDVIVKNIGNKKVNFIWFDFTDNDIPVEQFAELVNKKVDFNNLNFQTTEEINLTESVDWENLTLCTPGLNMSNGKELLSTTCSKESGTIFVDAEITQNIEGCIVAIQSGKQVMYDSRWSAGSPTLFKGVTSVVKGYNNRELTIVDDIEDFDRVYTNVNPADKSETSSNNSILKVFKPNAVLLKNCHFILTINEELAGTLSISKAVNVLIDNCSIQSENKIGSRALMTINNCVNGTIRRTIVKDSYFVGTDTSYGIQLNSCSRISVTDCVFSNHRRAVDFSGTHETRYCDVTNCKVLGSVDTSAYGSALGGHSTSCKNIIKNNYIVGNHATGIQLRGEQEIVDGNILCGYYSGSIFSAGYKSTFINNSNIIDGEGWDVQSTGFYIQLGVRDNYVNIINNNIVIREFLFGGQDSNMYINCRNNIIKYSASGSTSKQGVINGVYKGIFVDNSLIGQSVPFTYFSNSQGVICDNAKYDVLFCKWVGGLDVLPQSEKDKIVVNKAIAILDNSKKQSEYTSITMYLDFEVKESLGVALSLRISEDQNISNLLLNFGENISNAFVKDGSVSIGGEQKISSIICSSDKDMLYIGYETYSGKLPIGKYKMIISF